MIFLILIIHLVGTGFSTAEGVENERQSRGFPCITQASFTVRTFQIRPGDKASCEVNIEVTTYGDPLDVWLWLEGVPVEWTAELNRSHFGNVSCEESASFNLSIPDDVSVGILAYIQVGGLWSDGNTTGLVGSSQMQVFIMGPDLSISRSDFIIPDRGFLEGEWIPMNVRIKNVGDIGASNIYVRFLADGELFGVIHEVDHLEPGESRNLTYEWRAIHGKHTLGVKVDYLDSIKEYDELNNTAEIKIDVDQRPFYWEYALYLSIGLCIVVIIVRRMFGKK